MGPSVKETS